MADQREPRERLAMLFPERFSILNAMHGMPCSWCPANRVRNAGMFSNELVYELVECHFRSPSENVGLTPVALQNPSSTERVFAFASKRISGIGLARHFLSRQEQIREVELHASRNATSHPVMNTLDSALLLVEPKKLRNPCGASERFDNFGVSHHG